MQDTAVLGEQFARALAQKDVAMMRELLHPDIDFRGLTPSRTWEASGRDAVTALFLESWFEDSDEIEELVHLESDSVVDRTVKVRAHNAAGWGAWSTATTLPGI